jgi:hypothetical protein
MSRAATTLIDQADEIARRYAAGATLRELADEYISSAPTIRNRIIAAGGMIRAKNASRKPRVESRELPRDAVRPAVPRVWCDQCWRLVSLTEGQSCRRRFCKA